MLLALLSALVMAGGCLDRRSVVCSDGSICAAGTTCVIGLDLCASDSQVRACRGLPDAAPCAADGIPVGRCTLGVCLATGCNGFQEEGEQCDDGNTVGGDGCSADCRSDETCGNGIVDRGAGDLDEECDCGVADAVSPACSGPNSDIGGVCSRSCRRRCGDGAVSADEQCDWAAVGASLVSCGEAFDRGITTCRMDCTPNIDDTACLQIGWRTMQAQVLPPEPPVRDVAATALDHGFFVSARGAGEYNAMGGIATSFYTTAPIELRRVWADGSSAIAVGQAGTVLHWSGTAWTPGTSGTTVDLYDVWGRAPDDVYAVGAASTVLHWNGQTWQTMTTPQVGALTDLGGDATRVFAVASGGRLLRLQGGQWEVIDTGAGVELEGVWPTSSLVVAVGAAGTIVEDDGNGWRAGRSLSTEDLHAVWGSAAHGFFAVGDDGTILHREGRSWRPMALGRGVLGSASQSFTVVRETPGAIVGAIGTSDIIVYQGAGWSPTVVPTALSINGLWGSSSDDVFAVGSDGTILHFDGLRWTVQPSDTTVDLHAVHGRGPGDVYAVGDDLTVLHHDGVDWQTLRSGPSAAFSGDLRAVLAGDAGVVHVGGDEGLFRVESSGSLTRLVTTKVNGLWSKTPASGWAAGDRIHRLVNGVWSDVGVTVVTPLRGVTGVESSVFTVGGVSRQYNGTTWSNGPFVESNLSAVSANAAGGAFAVGSGGSLRYASGPAVEPLRARSTTELRAVHAIGHLVFIAGDDGTLDLLIFHQ
jgi:cysteine-rich repeat protein